MSETVRLQIDVGNSGTKWRLLRGERVAARGVYRAEDAGSRSALLGCSDEVAGIAVASVASDETNATLAALLTERWGVKPWFAATPARGGGLINSYRQPSRLGVDRWLAMLAARRRSGGRLCVVDVGSALTIDFVAADGRHEGGYIIPGRVLMAQALRAGTDRVRFDEDGSAELSPGRDTAQAVQRGINLALCGAVELALRVAERNGPHARLYLTGGGGAALAILLQREHEYCADLVFEGLSVMQREISS